MDQFTKIKLKDLFKKDKVHHDNILFKLHHQVNFFVILVGVLFIFGENYLNGKAIVCKGGDAYANQYCWLHGTGHLHSDLAKGITGLCSMDQEEVTEKNDRQTHYYLWLPFVLAVCMGLVKLPRVIWKSLFERGTMASLVERQTGEKIASRFNKLSRRTNIYFICFVICELLNMVAVIICFHIMNSLLNGKFWSYGVNVNNYYSSKPTQEELRSNPGLEAPNPMCNLFPTEVACNICTGSIGGGCNDKSSFLCILSNNLFNQYFFLILWCWWVFLIFISILGLLYRAAQMSIPTVSQSILQFHLTPFGLDYKASKLSLKPADMFMLAKLANNVKGSVMEEVLDEIMREGGEKKDLELKMVLTNDDDEQEKEMLANNV